ncbi:hypothetical protein STTU_6028 [Streptomyces sp. Tu6071]|nr:MULTISPECIES: hypothetical protein [unclassified Streptomyces]EGJ78818.1 hypothetical protein STTU_6028 [Streptomyces sp. Tu6071]
MPAQSAVSRHRGRLAPFLNRPVDLLRVNSALCPCLPRPARFSG